MYVSCKTHFASLFSLKSTLQSSKLTSATLGTMTEQSQQLPQPLSISDRLDRPLLELIYSYLSPSDLCAVALVNREQLDISSADRLWEPHWHTFCQSQQKGLLYKEQLQSSSPSWKHKYARIVEDSHRTVLTREELCHFDWQLVYNGQPSRLGLRRFHENGIYYSPYAGPVEWRLQENRLHFMNMALPIQRNLGKHTGEWILGLGYTSVYYSVEPTEEDEQR